MLRADPAGAAHTEAEAASRRFVSLGRGDAHGLKTLIARGEVLDIITFLATVNRVADLLALDGDPDPVQVRRSKAVGILGQPDRALALLAAHQHDDNEPGGTEPGGAEPAKADELEPDDEEPGPDDNEPGRRSLDLTRPASTSRTASIRIQLSVHLTDAALHGTDPNAVCRVEGVGTVTAHTIRRWLARSDVKITVRPVVVPGQAVPVDGYEIPHGIREAVWLRHPASAFPWSWCADRTSLQLDHVRAYLAMARGGPPGQTDPDNLAPLVGTEHQHKTSRRWQERSPAPGVYLWRSPHGWIELVTNQGTFPLGTTSTAQALWHAAAPATTHTRAA